MAREVNQYDDDDGRTICNMDVDGMPWQKNILRPEVKVNDENGEAAEAIVQQPVILTNKETRMFAFNGILAGLVVALAFAAFMILFTFFCTKIWLG